jgi:hypothetical protein
MTVNELLPLQSLGFLGAFECRAMTHPRPLCLSEGEVVLASLEIG